jgi:hypothetical protein
MTTFTQGIEALEFLISEASGMRSRATETVTVAGGVQLPSGTVLGRVTASGKLVKHASGASDGSQNAMAVLGTPLQGVANGDYRCLVFDRDCEVIGDRLNGGTGTGGAPATAALRALGIIVR